MVHLGLNLGWDWRQKTIKPENNTPYGDVSLYG